VAGEKVLLVDDTRLNRELAKDILDLQGYTIIEASNGREALDHARHDNPDIILLDIELPDMSGLEVVKVLKDDPRTEAIPVVAFTAHIEPGDQEEIIASGCAGYISKPFDVASFPQKIAEFLK
jgi:two-component system cell cycle response regulator DivK